MDWQRVISFLPLENVANIFVVNRELSHVVRKSVSWDVATIDAINALVFPMRSCRCVVQNVAILPTSLCEAIVPISFRFYRGFDATIHPGTLPSSLTSLVFPYLYNQMIHPGTLPMSLKSLELGDYYNWELTPGVLPPSLESLKLGEYFNRPIAPGDLPLSLTSLVFGCSFDQRLEVGSLPPSLATLDLGGHFNRRLTVDVLPQSLTSLTLSGWYDHQLERDVLPLALTSLVFGYYFNNVIQPGVLPSSLKNIKFGHAFNRPLLRGVLPLFLQSLVFGDSFNHPLTDLPRTLTTLVFGCSFDQSFSCPPSVTSLKFDNAQYLFTKLLGEQTSASFIKWIHDVMREKKHSGEPYFFFGPSNSGKTTIIDVVKCAFWSAFTVSIHAQNFALSSPRRLLFIPVKSEEEASRNFESARTFGQKYDCAVLICIDGPATTPHIISRGFSTLRSLEKSEIDARFYGDRYGSSLRRLVDGIAAL